MGRYRSDESDGDHSKKSRKKKKRRARSRSSSDSDSSRVSSSRSKKLKKKNRRSSRSHSRTPERKRGHEPRSLKRSRSSSLDKYQSRKPRSRSRSPERRRGRRSRSPQFKRGRSRSRSPSTRRRRSRSYSRGHRSRSPSRGARRRTRSRSHDRRSRSGERIDSYRSSGDPCPSNPSPSNFTMKGLSITDQVPGFRDMTPSEQAEERMRLALKAAALADEKLKIRGTEYTEGEITGLKGPTLEESQNFADSVAAIESGSFEPSAFKSSRSTKIKEEPMEAQATHDDAIFGSLAVTGFTIKPDPDMKPVDLDPDSIIHPNLYCDLDEKMDRWMQRLIQLRKRKLEGEAMQ